MIKHHIFFSFLYHLIPRKIRFSSLFEFHCFFPRFLFSSYYFSSFEWMEIQWTKFSKWLYRTHIYTHTRYQLDVRHSIHIFRRRWEKKSFRLLFLLGELFSLNKSHHVNFHCWAYKFVYRVRAHDFFLFDFPLYSCFFLWMNFARVQRAREIEKEACMQVGWKIDIFNASTHTNTCIWSIFQFSLDNQRIRLYFIFSSFIFLFYIQIMLSSETLADRLER